MPSHPTVFVIVVGQGESGEEGVEKDACFSIFLSSEGFLTL